MQLARKCWHLLTGQDSIYLIALHKHSPIQTVFTTAKGTISWLFASAYEDIILPLLLSASVNINFLKDALPASRLRLSGCGWQLCPSLHGTAVSRYAHDIAAKPIGIWHIRLLLLMAYKAANSCKGLLHDADTCQLKMFAALL